MKRIVLKVDRMSCGGCARAVTATLENKGAKEVEVSLSKGEVTFKIDDNLRAEDFAKAVTDIGYPASVQEESSPK